MTTVTITTAAPADPATVTEYGDALPELVRALNHVTKHPEALEFPSDADRLLRNLASMAGMLPQLVTQVSARLSAMQAAAVIEVTGGEYAGRPDMAVVAALMRLDEAAALAEAMGEALDGASRHTGCMGAQEDDSGEGSGDG